MLSSEEGADKLSNATFHGSLSSHVTDTGMSREVKRATCLITSIFCSVSVITEAIEIPQFIGRSYLTYDNTDILKR